VPTPLTSSRRLFVVVFCRRIFYHHIFYNHVFFSSSPIAIDVPHFGTMINGAREIFVLSSHDGIKWHEHQVMAEEEFLDKLPEGKLGCRFV